MYKTAKKFNILIITIVIISVITTVLINYITDPFFIFKTVNKQGFNLLKPCLTKQERMTKIPQIKLYKDKIDIIYTGSSKTEWWLDTDYQSKLSGKNVYSMTLSSSSLQESIIMAENSILIHPEIQTVFFGLDFFSFSKNFYDTSINISKIDNVKVTKEELIPLLLSFDTLNYSIKTIEENIKSLKKHPSKNNGEDKITNPRAEHYFMAAVKKYKRDYYSDYELNTSAIKELKDFEQFAKSRNVEIIFFITPTHITDLININLHGLSDDYYAFKKLLAENFGVCDLSMINKYNTEEVSTSIVYFRDSVHATKMAGEIFAKNFFESPNDSAVYLTKDNVINYNKADRQNLINYMQTHESAVNQVKEWIK